MEYIVNSPEWHYQQILLSLGEDINREGLEKTPARYINMMRQLTTKTEFDFTVFENEGIDEMIIQKNIPFYSLCEHHTAPFFGVAHVAYIPDKKIVGLSKLARTVKYYSSGLQNQERITSLVAEKLMYELNPLGVAVMLKAEHLCMSMRGVQVHGTETVTTKLVGMFKNEGEARHEFLSACY